MESWLFNDAPRKLRLSGIANIAELIEQLVAAAEDTTKRIKARLAQARELAAAINAVADKK